MVDTVLARESSGGTIAWYLPDRLGTIRDLISNSGAIIDHVDYSAFGTVLDESSPTSGDRMMGFAGMERDSVTGLNLAVEWVEIRGPGGGIARIRLDSWLLMTICTGTLQTHQRQGVTRLAWETGQRMDGRRRNKPSRTSGSGPSVPPGQWNPENELPCAKLYRKLRRQGVPEPEAFRRFENCMRGLDPDGNPIEDPVKKPVLPPKEPGHNRIRIPTISLPPAPAPPPTPVIIGTGIAIGVGVGLLLCPECLAAILLLAL